MMDWLYDELDRGAKADFKAHLTACSSCGEELRSLEETRQAFSDLPSEEPPAGVSAILLHEAAKRAPAKVAAREPLEDRSGGFFVWLGGLFQSIASHPAAAAVASLVLVAGVAGALYVSKGSSQVAQPELGSPAADERLVRIEPGEPSPTAGAAGADDDSDEPGFAGLELPEPALEDPSGAAAVATPRSTERGDGYAADLLPPADELELRQKVAEGQKSNRNESNRNESTPRRDFSKSRVTSAVKGKRAAKQSKAPPIANAISGTDPLITMDDEDAQGAAEGELRRQSGATTSTLGVADKSEGDKDRAVYRPYKERELDWAKTQRRALTQAVKKEDCRRAARLANDIIDRNPEYYTRNVKDSKDVKRCQWYVSDERKRRTKQENAQRSAKKRKKKSAGEPTKARAAPRQEDTAAGSAD